MMAKGSSKVQEQEKLTKKKTWKARLKKDAHNPPQHDKVKTKSPENDVRSSLDRIRHTGAQKERNVAQQINKRQDQIPLRTAHTQISVVTKREHAQVGHQKLTRYFLMFNQKLIHSSKMGDQDRNSPALEMIKKSEAKVLRRPHYSSAAPSKRNKVPLQPTLPPPPANGENQATVRIKSRAQTLLVDMAQQSLLNTPGTRQHELSALATELPLKQNLAGVTEEIVTTNNDVPGVEGEGINYSKEDTIRTVFTEGVGESNYLQEDDATQIVITEVSVSTEPRQVSLFDDWRPGPQKIDKPPSIDRNHWLRFEMEKQHEIRLAQKKATRKNEMRNLRRFEGAGVDDTNITPLSIYSSQSIANSTIREDVEESALGYAKFLYRPGAAWMNLGLNSTFSMRSFGPPETESGPKSCESRKSTTEIVLAISSASARREAMRKELAERIRQDLLRKKLLISQNRAAARAHSQCRCC